MRYNYDELADEGVTAEDLAKSLEIISLRLLSIEETTGVVAGLSTAVMELDIGLKLLICETLNELCQEILNEPRETRQ
jgi:hypothetical protein